MTKPGKTIRIDDNKVISNSREELYHDEGIKKNFIFKGYKTEKERIVMCIIQLYLTILL
jgi:hypothetical protein